MRGGHTGERNPKRSVNALDERQLFALREAADAGPDGLQRVLDLVDDWLSRVGLIKRRRICRGWWEIKITEKGLDVLRRADG